MAPLVSILIPVFNASSTLRACLASIMRQSERSWECIIVDDGSSDNTASLALAFSAADDRFSLIRQPHSGIVTALNAGLDQCTGSLVARMDADDIMHKHRLSEQIQKLERDRGLAAVGCHVRVFPRAGLTDGLRAYERWLNQMLQPVDIASGAFVECPVAHPSLMFRREVLAELRYRDPGWPEDYDLVLRLLETGGRIGVVPRTLLFWRDSRRRLWRTSNRYSQERFTACKAAFLAQRFLSRHSRYTLWGYGATGRSLRRALETWGKRPAYIVELHPGRLGKIIHGARVIRPEELARTPRFPLVVSVAGEQPRKEIRWFLGEQGFVEREDFVCAA